MTSLSQIFSNTLLTRKPVFVDKFAGRVNSAILPKSIYRVVHHKMNYSFPAY